MTTMTETTTQVYQLYIRATPEQVWDAITKSDFTQQYFYGARIDVRDGRRFSAIGELEWDDEVLESELEMTRFGVMKHLRVLEDAGLVVTRREGREKLHFLNPVPIRLIHDRWIDKYTEHRVAALADLKHELEESA